MTNTFKFGAAGLAIAAMGMSAPAFAQSTASASAEAEILSALTLTNVSGSELNFGNIVITNTPTALAPETVTLDPSDMSVACSANLVCSGTTTAAQFHAQGDGNNELRVDLPTTTTLSYNDGTTTHTMTVDSFSIYSLNNTYGTGNLQEFTLDANGMIQVDGFGNPITNDVLVGGNPVEVTTIDLDTGNAYFSVGARLLIEDAMAAGVYTGSFNVSVEYN